MDVGKIGKHTVVPQNQVESKQSSVDKKVESQSFALKLKTEGKMPEKATIGGPMLHGERVINKDLPPTQ